MTVASVNFASDHSVKTQKLVPTNLSFKLHESNTTNNPFPPGSATGLVGVLGYAVNLDRVKENDAGIAACIKELKGLACNENAEAASSCSGTVIPGEGACSLTNLFDPALKIGDRCALGEGAGKCSAGGDAGDACTFGDSSKPVPDDEEQSCKAGLKCHPSSLKCVSNCEDSFPCATDFECKEGQSYSPLVIGDDSASCACLPRHRNKSSRQL